MFTSTWIIAVLILLLSACNDVNEANTDDLIGALQADIEQLNEQNEQLKDQLVERDNRIAELESELQETENNSNSSDETAADEDYLKDRADNVVIALENKNFESLATYVHPDKGIRFSPYGHVNPEEDLLFTAEEVTAFAQDTEEYEWGTEDGSGHPIVMTPSQYYEEYIYIRDFSRESQEIAVNKIESHGNIPVNVEEEYPEADFVNYLVAANEDQLNWANLILAFEEYEGEWYLVGLAVDRWTT